MTSKNFRVSLLALAVAGATGAVYANLDELSGAVTPAPISVTPVIPKINAAAGLPDFAAIVAKNGPAVVNISVSGHTKVAMQQMPELDPDDPMNEFFRRFQPPGQAGGEMPTQGMGSGFIIRPDGLVMTNAHVVDGASEVTVKLTDKREFKAKVIGIDKPTDTAVLKIDAKNLPTVNLGDPAQTGVGEWVLAIGSPFGFENSVTAGIVSAKSRTLPDEGFVPFIQTDVAVNPGNSGGPLFNLRGEVIGINSQIYSRTGGYQGLSFAIPIDVALKVEEQLLHEGKVTRARIGVSVQAISQALAESFGLAQNSGALVDSVTEIGPAAKAGIRPGDIILNINGQTIQEPAELGRLVSGLKPGSEAKLTVWREGGKKEISVKTIAAEESGQVAAIPDELAKSRLGLAVRPLLPQETRQSDVNGGLVVERSTGAAARAGIQTGDVVLAVNGHPVSDPAQLREFASKADKRLALLVQRGANRLFVPIQLG
jgi:serine protease Do